RLNAVVACEIDPAEAARARYQGRRLGQLDLIEGDFLHWYLQRADAEPPFDAVLGNPPFIRYQYLDEELQARAGAVFARCGLAFTKHTNAWVPFVVAALTMLRSGGRLGMVVPAELLHVRHARPLRQFLARTCSRVWVLDPEERWFEGTLQGV